MSSDEEETDDFFDQFAPLPRNLSTPPAAPAGQLGFKRLHVLFVVDLSRSMERNDLQDSSDRRIDSVLNCIAEFIAAQLSKQEASLDTYSLVTFNAVANTVFNNEKPIIAMGRVTNQLLYPFGPTNFLTALQALPSLIDPSQYAARIIFLSDGRPGDWTHNAVSWFQTWLERNSDLEFHTIGFGMDVSDFEVLQQMAQLGGGGFQLASLNSAFLRKAFTSLSTSITATRLQSTDLDCGGYSSINSRRRRKLVFTAPWLQKVPLQKGLRITCTRERFRWNAVFQDVERISRETAEVVRRKNPHTKGSLRYVFAMTDYSIGGKMVSKESLFEKTDRDSEMCFVKSSAAAEYFAKLFSQATGCVVRVLPCYLYSEATGRNNHASLPHFCAEPFLGGVFVKWVGNFGFINREADSSVLECFAHYTYHLSHKQLMVADIQGVNQEGAYVLTDPQLLSADQRFGRADLGNEGMRHFLEEHRCGPLCRKLRIDIASALRPTNGPSIPQTGHTLHFQRHYTALTAAMQTLERPSLESLIQVQSPESIVQKLTLPVQQRKNVSELIHTCIVGALHPTLRPMEVYESGSFKRGTALFYNFDVDLVIQMNDFNFRHMTRYFSSMNRALTSSFSNMVRFDRKPTRRCLKVSICKGNRFVLHVDLVVTGNPDDNKHNNPSSYYQGMGSKTVDAKLASMFNRYPVLKALSMVCKHWRNMYEDNERPTSARGAHIKSYYIELLCVEVVLAMNPSNVRQGFKAFLQNLVQGSAAVTNLNPFSTRVFQPHPRSISLYRAHASKTLRLYFPDLSSPVSEHAFACACAHALQEKIDHDEVSDTEDDFFDYYY